MYSKKPITKQKRKKSLSYNNKTNNEVPKILQRGGGGLFNPSNLALHATVPQPKHW